MPIKGMYHRFCQRFSATGADGQGRSGGYGIESGSNSRRICVAGLISAWVSALPVSASAQVSVPFSGEVTAPNACIIMVTGDGTLAPNVDDTVLSSKEAAGSSGSARVYSFWRYQISVDTPSSFSSAPPGGSTNVDFQSLFSGTSVYRGRNFPERQGSNSVRLRNGFSVTDIDVNMVATRTGSSFPSGAYSAWATVRCE